MSTGHYPMHGVRWCFMAGRTISEGREQYHGVIPSDGSGSALATEHSMLSSGSSDGSTKYVREYIR